MEGWAVAVTLARVAPAIVVALAAARVGLGRSAALALAVLVALALAAWGEASVAVIAATLARGSLVDQATVLGREAAVGLALGLTAAVPLLAAELVGAWLAAAVGESDGHGPWQDTTGLIGALAFFALGGHRAVIAALAASYRVLPVGVDAAGVVEVSATLFASAVALAIPILGAVLIAVLATAAVERVALTAAGVVPPALAVRLGAVVALAAMVFVLAHGVGRLTAGLPLVLSAGR